MGLAVLGRILVRFSNEDSVKSVWECWSEGWVGFTVVSSSVLFGVVYVTRDVGPF